MNWPKSDMILPYVNEYQFVKTSNFDAYKLRLSKYGMIAPQLFQTKTVCLNGANDFV